MSSFRTLDEAYRALTPSLVSYAQGHIFNRSYAIDAVHDAFVKAQVYINKNPGKHISGFLLKREVARACRRLNKRYSTEISVDIEKLNGLTSKDSTGFEID